MATFSTHQDNLLELERQIQGVVDFANSVTDPTFGHVRIRIGKHLMQDLAWLATQTGNATAIAGFDAGIGNPLVGSNAPKSIMGKVVGESRTPVTADTLAPKKDDVAKFTAKVNDLYLGFIGLKDKDVLAILSKPGGEGLVRGVAKKAGLENWESIESTEMDIMFFADIRTAIKENAQSANLAAQIDGKLADNDADEDADEEPVVAAKKAAPAKKSAPVKKAVAAKKLVIDDEDDEDA